MLSATTLARRSLILLFASLGAAGCPQLLSDDFETSPASSAGGSGGDASLGGSGGQSGTDGSAGDAAADADADGAGGCSACQPEETCCDEQCFDTNKSPTHCGSCSTGCPGTTCVSGQCTNTCVLGYLDCDMNAVSGCETNAATDPDNCGSCGAKCGFDQSCSGGKCVCPASRADCDGKPNNGCETNLSNDPQNCGACGKSCGANQACAGATCVCAPGFGDCNGMADDGCEANLTTNVAHCGGCNKTCGQNGTCALGQCGCLPGFLDCDSSPGCESAKLDPAHCGSCSVTCGTPTPVCSSGGCVANCSGSETLCGSSCVDTSADPVHCGGCNKPVGKNQVCSAGVPTCITGWADCNQQPGDGCEVDITSDPAHCGGCSTVCKPGSVCSGSACQCGASTPNDCGAECRECCADADCADANPCTTDSCSAAGKCNAPVACASGTTCCALGCFECCVDSDCAGGKVCSGNQCAAPTCTAPEILCSQKCVNPSTDSKNCGGCNVDCGVGRACSAGACSPAWAPLGGTPPSARSHAAYTSMTNPARVFVWGGANGAGAPLGDGAIYQVATDSWTPVAKDANTPSARLLAAAVWTGNEVFVWGGSDGAKDLADGGLYDPGTTSWKPVATAGAPSARRAPATLWTGSKVLLFGGFDANGAPLSGAFTYDPSANQWQAASTAGEPSARLNPTTGWNGSELFVYGGFAGGTSYNTTHRYRVADDAWSQLSNGPNARHGALGAWDGSLFVAWGGRKEATTPTVYADGKRYSPTSGNWSNCSAVNEPQGRWSPRRESGMASRIASDTTLFLGGLDATGKALTDGAIYNSTSNGWKPVSSWPSGEEHRFGVFAWAGGEAVVWGGLHGSGATATGERFRP